MITWKRKFAVIWTGQAISIFTSSIIQMAIIWYLTDKTKSATILSLATLAGFLPQAVLGPFIGSFADVIGVEKWFFLSGVLTVTIAVICYLLPSLRNCCNDKEIRQ